MSIAKRGFGGTVRVVAARVLDRAKEFGTRTRRKNVIEGDAEWYGTDRDAPDTFDLKYKIDTGGAIRLAELDLDCETWVYGNSYQPTGGANFAQLWQGLELPYEEFTFIDIGSGKGRPVLLAAGFPFRRIIGVEFSRELHSVAEKNLRRFPDEAKKCKDIQLVCMDATQYPLPQEPLVLYLADPFARPVMVRFIESLNESFQRRPRRIVVLYVAPKSPDLWDGVAFLKKVKATQSLFVYDTLEMVSGA